MRDYRFGDVLRRREQYRPLGWLVMYVGPGEFGSSACLNLDDRDEGFGDVVGIYLDEPDPSAWELLDE